ncbi:MAG: tryptophan--tRNA ligase, partial [Parvularcula sp.]|nr:tryptophan--tRNA ligase [Parvularcula sp.]
EGRPEAANLVNIYAALSGETVEDVLRRFGGQGFGVLKPALADLAVEKLAPLSTQMNELMADQGEIDRVLMNGAERADAIAAPILAQVKEIMGFLPRR